MRLGALKPTGVVAVDLLLLATYVTLAWVIAATVFAVWVATRK